MAANLVKKLDELVKKKQKVSVKSVQALLKAKESEIIDAAMKLSDEFSVTKKDGKVSLIIYNRKSNVKEIIEELTKIIKKIKDSEFKEIKKVLLTCIMFLEKKQYIENLDKVKKEINDYSKDIDVYVKSFNEMKELETKSEYYSDLVKKYSNKIEEDTKIMHEHSDSLNMILELMRKSFDTVKKNKEKNDSSTEGLHLLILGEKIKHKSILELLGIRKIMPEKKPEIKQDDKKNDSNKDEYSDKKGSEKRVEKDAQKDNDVIPHDEKQDAKSSAIKISGKFSTEIDELLKLVKDEGTVTFNKLAKLYEEKIETIEGWCEALEETGLISIHYPLIGSPYIKYEIKELKE
ncbi:MAG: hypothetical protein PHN56_06415 [Candidatus Nanoarchaeia archaeon]|nr:hypothetical protein [Candidatus Nanoarchaeia archaeon]